jgi:hypothetical protein
MIMTEVLPPTPGDTALITKSGALVALRSVGGAWRVLDDINAGDPAPSLAGLPEMDDFDGPPRPGAVRIRIGSVDYELAGGELSRYAPDGELLSSVALPMDPLIAAVHRAGPGAVSRFEHFSRQRQHLQCLAYDERRNRIIAWAWLLPGWVMAIGLDGAIEWATVPTIDCCNFVCLLPREDVVVHLSSCGSQVTFISGDGATQAVRKFEAPPTSIYPDGEGGVVVAFVEGGIAGFDVLGAQKWALDCPRVRSVVADAGVLYAVMSTGPGLLEVNALEVGE